MKMNRLSPVLLLLALAGPATHAQDMGPGVMIQELASLSDAGHAQDSGRVRGVLAPRQARRPVEGRNAVDADLKGGTGSESGACADLRCNPATTSALRIPDTPGLDDRIMDRAR